MRKQLRDAGFSSAAIDAVWPSWWSADAVRSKSARAQLTFTVARRLGVSPQGLLNGSTQFVWRDNAKFKRLSAADAQEQAALVAFATGIAQTALRGVPPADAPTALEPEAVREALLAGGRTPELLGLLALCWSLGIPVLSFKVFPLPQKRMQAMSLRLDDRYVIIIGQASKYAAPLAFTLAHEIGHIARGHLRDTPALVDVGFDSEVMLVADDDEELSANDFALRLLTGRSRPTFEASQGDFTASQLADAARQAGREEGIDPAILALCFAHASGGFWKEALGAVKVLSPSERDWNELLNVYALEQVDSDALSVEDSDYLARVLGVTDAL